jgi:hypothetical protein
MVLLFWTSQQPSFRKVFWLPTILTLSENRLIRMRSPEGVTLEIVRKTDGTQQLLREGSALVTLSPDWDNLKTHKNYRLQFADKTAFLEMGKRLVLVSGKGTKTAAVDSLVSVQFNGALKRGFTFKDGELLVAGNLYRWDTSSYQILQAGMTKYSFPTIQGVQCAKITFPSGETQIWGSGADGVTISQEGAAPILIRKSFTSGHLWQKERQSFHLMPNGDLVLLREYWYDEKGNVIRKFVHDENGGIVYGRLGNELFAQNAKDQKSIWRKIFDPNGRLIEFQYGQKCFNFDYLSNGKVKMISMNGAENSEQVFSYSEIAHLTKALSQSM